VTQPGRSEGSPSRDLTALFEPSSLAVVGASGDPTKWGHGTARRALLGQHRRRVYLVNRNVGEVLGQPTFPSVSALPEPPELVIVAVQASAFEQVVDDALAGGAKAIVVMSAGLGETGPEGCRRERVVRDRVRAAGAVLMGPNCLGVFDATAELEINNLAHGSIAVVSQSGNFGLEVSELASDHGLGISRFASLGNQADLEFAEVIADLAHHEPTALIALYCEDFRDGRAFARACRTAVEAGKPVLLLDAGRTAAGAAAARSHTGALLSDSRAVASACAAAGILRVDSPTEMIDLAVGLLSGARIRGRRLGVLTDGGGTGAVVSDLASARGFDVSRLSDPLSAALTAALSPGAPTRNPVDLADAGPKDYWSYERAARLLLESGEVDSVLLTGYYGGYSRYSEDACRREVEVAHALGQLVREQPGRFVAQTMYWSSQPAQALRQDGIAVYRDAGAALGVLRRLADREESPPRGVPDLPGPADQAIRAGYFEARELLADAGIEFAPAREVADLESARTAASAVGYPVVLKALGRLHKSDGGGVVLDIRDDAALVGVFAELHRRLRAPSYSLEQMISAGKAVELVVGVRRDPRFGPVALAGLGGVYAEVLDDIVTALAPLGEADALELLGSLRGAGLLRGVRGGPVVSLGGAARAWARLSSVAAAHPEIAEIEVNPLLVTGAGAVGLDARIVLAGDRLAPVAT
jgi:acyl-CoA synthetase (NDP forming)